MKLKFEFKNTQKPLKAVEIHLKVKTSLNLNFRTRKNRYNSFKSKAKKAVKTNIWMLELEKAVEIHSKTSLKKPLKTNIWTLEQEKTVKIWMLEQAKKPLKAVGKFEFSYTSCIVWAEQNWLSSWWTLSKIKGLSYSSQCSGTFWSGQFSLF